MINKHTSQPHLIVSVFLYRAIQTSLDQLVSNTTSVKITLQYKMKSMNTAQNEFIKEKNKFYKLIICMSTYKMLIEATMQLLVQETCKYDLAN